MPSKPSHRSRRRGSVLYRNDLKRLRNPPSILADYPQYVEPLVWDRRWLAPPVVCERGGRIAVRSWRYWYNVRGIVDMDNRLDASATAIINVHPWGVDDGHGLESPEPAGCAFFCTPEKNQIALAHMREVLSPFFRRWRPHVALIAHSLPGTEDPVRRLLYPSIGTPPEAVDPKRGERMLRKILDRRRFRGWPVPRRFRLDPESPVRSYMDQTPSTEHGTRRNGPGFWNLPMPIATAVECGPRDMVFYDGEGYDKVRDALRKAGIRHVLLTGYATDMCVIRTTCGYQNLSRDFNVFLVGDATLATFPGSRTPRFVTQAALTSASLSQMITQVSWVRLVPPSSGTGEAP